MLMIFQNNSDSMLVRLIQYLIVTLSMDVVEGVFKNMVLKRKFYGITNISDIGRMQCMGREVFTLQIQK